MLVPPAILLLEYKSKAEMAHIPQSQDDHQITMEDSEHNFQNVPEDIQMVRSLFVCSFVPHGDAASLTSKRFDCLAV